MDYRTILQKAWRRATDFYDLGKINSERTLHSYLYSQLVELLPDRIILCEPQLQMGKNGTFVPDIVILNNEMIVAVLEIKFVPYGYPVYEQDISKLRIIGANKEPNTHRIFITPATGELSEKVVSIDQNCLLSFAVIGKVDANAICPECLNLAISTDENSVLQDRFEPLIYSISK